MQKEGVSEIISKEIERFRDIYKYVDARTDGKAVYLMLGLEVQDKANYAMPVRTMLYDAMEYALQVQETAKLIKKEDKEKPERKVESAEFLSGFGKDDRLIPVITLVLYLNPGTWDGPRSLSDMYAPYDDAIKPYINDYKINLISPAELNQGDFAKFHTDFGKVLEFIKCSADKGKMKKFKEENADFAFSAEAVIFLNKTTHSKLTLNKNEEEIVMCKALDDMCADAREEGRAEGLTAGHAAGHAEGLALGRTEVEHMSKLISLLLSKNRFEEARQAADNEAVRKELYARYSIV
ncbi:MAG: hypothetical protein ACOX76_10190 [Lachnospiraceae bacterium]|jgi:hypothetical protein